jgi:hypothetical protein
VDSEVTENFIVLEAAVSAKLRTLKKRVLYKLHLADRQLAKSNRVIQYEIQEFEI